MQEENATKLIDIEKDLNFDDLNITETEFDFAALGGTTTFLTPPEDIKRFYNDPRIKKAIQEMDLREYAKNINAELSAAETAAVPDCMISFLPF